MTKEQHEKKLKEVIEYLLKKYRKTFKDLAKYDNTHKNN